MNKKEAIEQVTLRTLDINNRIMSLFSVECLNSGRSTLEIHIELQKLKK